MNQQTGAAQQSTETAISDIELEVSSPLPIFGHCSEIHTSSTPNLPEVGESEEQAKKLFVHPSQPDRLW